MNKWLKNVLPDKDPYHNRGRDQLRKKGGGSGIRVPVTDMPKTSLDRLDFYLSGPTVRHISICLHVDMSVHSVNMQPCQYALTQSTGRHVSTLTHSPQVDMSVHSDTQSTGRHVSTLFNTDHRQPCQYTQTHYSDKAFNLPDLDTSILDR